MVSARDDYVRHCAELLAPAGSVRVRRMFGGHGLYVDELFIALIIAEQLYLKADASTRGRFEAAGCRPFVYEASGGGRVSVSYFSAPDDAMESPMLMQPWARLALEAALRARAAKPRARTRAPNSAAKATAAKPRRAPAKARAGNG
ncbi:MAG: TfoX/Sxy family protein [Proteobacteria bacterium]|nr:TfoX/Sxy family protein [Pseudomonadota bacterium]